MRVTSTIDIPSYLDDRGIEASAVEKMLEDVNTRLKGSGICAYQLLSGRLQDVQGEVLHVGPTKMSSFSFIITVKVLDTPAGKLVGLFKEPRVTCGFLAGTDSEDETIIDIKLSRVGIVDGAYNGGYHGAGQG